MLRPPGLLSVVTIWHASYSSLQWRELFLDRPMGQSGMERREALTPSLALLGSLGSPTRLIP
eukprot:scaffold296183_cov36-Prasinocladus_malaysianus.AAC.1